MNTMYLKNNDVCYKFNDIGTRNIYGYLDKKEVSSIIYGLKDNEITIIDITSKQSESTSKNSHHFGTEIFNELLLHLKNNNEYIISIKGSLSPLDAKKGNWGKSLKFYYDFSRWLDSRLEYELEFSLYDDKNFQHRIALPIDRSQCLQYFEEFTKEHIEFQKWASFSYLIK